MPSVCDAASTAAGCCCHDHRVDLIAALVTQIDWSELGHAYGPASDAPFRLLALLGDDIEARSAGVAYLDSAILHQDTIWSATAPVARVVAAMLGDPRTTAPVENVLPWDAGPRPLRLDLVGFLARVAQSCLFDADEVALPAQEDPVAGSESAFRSATSPRDVQACRATAPELLAAVMPLCDDRDDRIRAKAFEAVVRLSGHPDLHELQPEIAVRLEAAATEFGDPWARAAAARLLALLRADPQVLLSDGHQGVRACAALAPTLADEPRAIRAILDALLTPREADHWFEGHLPGQEGWLRFDLIWAAVERVDDFGELLPAALATLPLAGIFTLDKDVGPFVTAAFPRPFRSGDVLSAPQRIYVSALLEQEGLWRGATSRPWFRRTGLPIDPDSCRALC